jgi:hypothetical protein
MRAGDDDWSAKELFSLPDSVDLWELTGMDKLALAVFEWSKDLADCVSREAEKQTPRYSPRLT